MRVLIRRQMRSISFNPCACAVAETIDLLRENERDIRETGFGWIEARQTSERIPDQLHKIDDRCDVSVFHFNEPIQAAIVKENLADYLNAVAGLVLELCGMNFPPEGMEITMAEIDEAARRQVEREKELEALK